ncbi:MAG TPA: site-2 protease family protein [Stellaceae bacterium]|nr:site-2 protease family protein [Stellaceae bacterium]
MAALISWTLARVVFPDLAPNLPIATYWSMAIVATIGLLFSIVFHEMAHSLVARHYGMPIRGITLFIFGGVAEMEQEPPSPKSELLMAAAGPAASMTLAIGLFALVNLATAGSAPGALEALLYYLGLMNGVLALFNIVPAFPLDGGRMLRAALWMWRGDLAWATRIASGAGNVFGVTLMALGVFSIMTGDFIGGMWRFLIGMFLRGAAEASYREVIARNALQGVPVSRVMHKDPISPEPEVTVANFVEDFVYSHHHRTFPVTRQGRLVGSVGTEQVAHVDRAAWPATPIGRIMARVSAEDVVEPGADVLATLAQMRRHGRPRLWVVEDGRLVGVLSLRDMLELLATKLELERDRGDRHRSPVGMTGRKYPPS